MPSDLVVGVDGGGTWTRCVILSDQGEVISWGRAGPSNPITIGVEQALENIQEAINEAKKELGAESFKSSVLGLAGIDRSHLRDEIIKGLPSSLGVTELVSDARSALAGGTGLRPGVVVIAGTGSIAYGVNESGIEARAGGWGWRLGDEGSGYTIGKNAMIAALRYHDGSGPSTVLRDRILSHLKLDSPEAVIDWAYSKSRQPRDFADLVPLVKKAELEGDRVAAEIMFDQGIELGRITQAVIRKLSLRGKFPVACCGGVFLQPNGFNSGFEKTVRQSASKCEFVEPRFSPTIGSALLALQHLGVDVDDDLLSHLEEQV